MSDRAFFSFLHRSSTTTLPFVVVWRIVARLSNTQCRWMSGGIALVAAHLWWACRALLLGKTSRKRSPNCPSNRAGGEGDHLSAPGWGNISRYRVFTTAVWSPSHYRTHLRSDKRDAIRFAIARDTFNRHTVVTLSHNGCHRRQYVNIARPKDILYHISSSTRYISPNHRA